MLYIKKINSFIVWVFFLSIIQNILGCSKKLDVIYTISEPVEKKEIILQKKILIKEMAESSKILHDVSWPILKKNKEHCKRSESLSYGFIVASAEDIPSSEEFLFNEIFNKDIDKYYFNIYETKNFPIVISVAKNSPAEDAGLKENDIILEVNDRRAKNIRALLFENLSQKKFLKLKILRKDKVFVKNMSGIKICSYNVQPLPSAMPNAFADGKKIFITIGAIKLAESLDELAFLVGHELAHNIYHYKSTGNSEAYSHSIKYDDKPKIRELKSILVYSNQEKEIEADIKGIELAYKGGFKLNNVNDYWRRLSVFYPELIENSYFNYRGNAFRASLIDKTLKKINKKND